MPGQPVRVTLVEVAAHADVPVGQGEDRLALGQQLEIAQPQLADRPRLDRVARVRNHRSCPRSVTTMSAPWVASSRPCCASSRLTPTTKPKPPARPACDPGDRVFEHRRLPRLDAQTPGRRPGTNPAPVCRRGAGRSGCCRRSPARRRGPGRPPRARRRHSRWRTPRLYATRPRPPPASTGANPRRRSRRRAGSARGRARSWRWRCRARCRSVVVGRPVGQVEAPGGQQRAAPRLSRGRPSTYSS